MLRGWLHALLGRKGRVAPLLVALPLRVREEPAFGDRGGDNGRENDHVTSKENCVFSMIPALEVAPSELVAYGKSAIDPFYRDVRSSYQCSAVAVAPARFGSIT
jgi:hypothetical protein